MTTAEKTAITVQATVKAPVQKVWTLWTSPDHIKKWNNASPDWHTPEAENDVRAGGRFRSRMESKDGTMGFDFTGTYDEVDIHRSIRYTMDDGRQATVHFVPFGNQTTITETFEAESTLSEDIQREGWQAILNNFATYAEAPGTLNAMHVQIVINAPAEKVYHTMLDDKTYRQWTVAFCPVSFYRGKWEKGEKLHFIGIDKDGNEGGMVAQIDENIPNQFVSIRHLGIVKNGEEITSGPEVDSWAGAHENYTFTETDGYTLLSVDVDVNEEFHTYFTNTWPKALERLKELCEA